MVEYGVDYAEVADLGMQTCNNFYPTKINIDVEPLVLFGQVILGNSGETQLNDGFLSKFRIPPSEIASQL